MTELGLIVGIDVVGLVLALLMGRGVSVRDPGPVAIRRLGSALERAARAFLWQEYRQIALGSGLLLALLVAAASRLELGSDSMSRLAIGFWCSAGLCLGAVGATISGYVGTVLGVRGSVRAAAAASRSVDAALGIAMRAGGAAGLLSETLSGLCVAGLFSVLFAVQGGFAVSGAAVQPLLSRVVLILPSFVLGAAVAALVLQRGGGSFHAASGVGADQAGERDAGLEHDDPRNPAVVAELVGDHVGASATRHVDAFVSASLANVAALMIGPTLSRGTPVADPLLLLALPLVVRAFGVIASAFAVFLVRTDDAANVNSAVLRGYVSNAVISWAALGGVSYWLFGEHFIVVFVANGLGLLTALLAPHALLLRLSRRGDAARDHSDALRVGSGGVIAGGLAAGLEAVLLPIIVVGLGLTVSFVIGARSGVAAGGPLGVLMFALAASSVTPFVLSIAALGSIADGARGIAAMCNADAEHKRRSARLDEAGFTSAAVARHYGAFASVVSSLLAAWAIADQTQLGSSFTPSLGGSSVLIWSGALGGAVVLAYAGSAARAAVRGARDVSAEVERQLRGFPREHGMLQVPTDYTPSYKSCVELSSAVALRRVGLPIAGGLAAPLLLGLALRFSFHGTAPEMMGLGLTWFVVVASFTGLGWALVIDTARVTVVSARRSSRGRENGVAFNASISADAWSDILGNAAAPALQLLVKAAAATALIITPFLL